MNENSKENQQGTVQTTPSPFWGGPGRGLSIRVGMGYDVHQLVEGRDLWLGGIKIEHTLDRALITWLIVH